ncbi:auxin response factor 2B-like [Olea europaea var. sylvestris]|uniref:auxin response factor 2B-like n=1 Tax=Olea europaea var. sylvestris TaxID=158386 RepID=UPI000C1D1DA5|nr:auxin response factor 2B-like [Olea europaea var. sylvestris]
MQAEPNTDEAIAHITLVPQKDGESSQHRTTPSIARESFIQSFSKKLTPSDTSTHGGLSVPRKCANECFPPLDMFQHLPSQDLVAKDLHGTEWSFRHIYRGQPKRHLLSSGWSSFVHSKKLNAGDTCIFFRGKTSKLFIGIRRAIKPENNTSVSLLSSQSIQHGVLSGAFHAISTESLFNVHYYPWKSPAEFIIPYDQYMKAAEVDYGFGMRFKMQFESTEGFQVERSPKCGGTIIGIKDIDHIRWPGSEWRCIKVKWDSAEEAAICPERVSPWSIDLIEIYKRKRKSIPPDSKKPQPVNPLFPFSVKDGLTKNSVEHIHQRHAGVFQGQEFGTVNAYNQRPSTWLPAGDSGTCMLFGVNILGNQPKVPSPQFLVGSELNGSNLAPPPSSQADILETINVQERSDSNLKEELYSCLHISRSCTKVLKYGTALGRSINLSHFNGYGELVSELDKIFEFNGALIDGSSNWRLSYTDGERDKMFGDCTWKEFRAIVKKMFICPKEVADSAHARAPI